MNIFKFGRGDIFGILIPGAFIVINLIFIFNVPFDGSLFKTFGIDVAAFINNTGFLLICFIVASYVFGFGLRVIDPSKVEYIYYLFWWPLHLILAGIKYIRQSDNKTSSYSE